MNFAKALKEMERYLSPLPLPKDELTAWQKQSIYDAAMSQYLSGSYTQAADFFIQLILQDPHEVKFWRGLACARQMQESYEEALRAWSIVCLLDEQSAEGHFHAAQCYVALGNANEAQKALNLAKNLKEKNGPSN